jgi:hypothetical protein
MHRLEMMIYPIYINNRQSHINPISYPGLNGYVLVMKQFHRHHRSVISPIFLGYNKVGHWQTGNDRMDRFDRSLNEITYSPVCVPWFVWRIFIGLQRWFWKNQKLENNNNTKLFTVSINNQEKNALQFDK